MAQLARRLGADCHLHLSWCHVMIAQPAGLVRQSLRRVAVQQSLKDSSLDLPHLFDGARFPRAQSGSHCP